MNVKTKGYTLACISAVTYGTIPLFALPIKHAGYSFDTALFYRFLFSAILIGDEKLFLCMPILMLIYTGAPIALKSIVILSRRLEREKIEITREKSEFLRIMNIEAERFKLIGAHGTREAAKLMDELDAKVRDTLVSQVKHVIHSEEMVREAIRKRHPELTDAEAEVALLIVKDKTVSEICEIRHVSPSTVTSIRSRLRKKAGLRPEESLKSHLKSVVNAYITAG